MEALRRVSRLGFAHIVMVIPMGKKVFVIISVAILFATIPVIRFRHLPLIDYPNHLASLQIRKTLSSSIYIKHFYEVRWEFTPNLGLDLLATPFISFMPVELVGRIVIGFTFVMIYVGTILLNRQINPNNWGPSIFSGIFLYNGAFNWGFINYIIGIGFAILAFWIWVRYREKAVGISILLFTLLGGMVCLMHFYAFAIYGVCVAGYECSVFWEKLRMERRLRMSLFIIPFGAAVSLMVPLLALFSSVSGDHGPMVWGRSWGPTTFWDSIVKWKGEALASPIYFHYFSEKPLLLAMIAILVWALATRRLVVNSRMVIPLVAFGVIFMVMPSELWGASFADYRLPSGVAFFAWASLGWGETSRARIGVVCLLLSFCLIVRVGSAFSTWQSAQPFLEEYDTALQLVPPGSRLLVITDDSGWSNPPLVHLPVLAAAKQGVFDPNTFTDHGEPHGLQLVKKKPDYRDYQGDLTPSSIREIRMFDYLLEIRNPQVTIPTGISLKEVERGQTFTLYRIDGGTAK
jgi:hypothetical protein